MKGEKPNTKINEEVFYWTHPSQREIKYLYLYKLHLTIKHKTIKSIMEKKNKVQSDVINKTEAMGVHFTIQ